MKIYTLNIGQGQFVVVVGDTEAVIVDTYVPLSPKQEVIFVKEALAAILKEKNLIGTIITGFDDDHLDEVGIKLALNLYRPDMVIYPRYYKDTDNAKTCFKFIDEYISKNKDKKKISFKLEKNSDRKYTLGKEFDIEFFSPHEKDMDSSNNCSLVCKLTEKSTKRSYLITGDCENGRWDSIVKYFGSAIKSDVLDVPHHGSENGITEAALNLIAPKDALISAGVDSEYGHPDDSVIKLLKATGCKIYSTNEGKGKSYLTIADNRGVITTEWSPKK